MSSQDVFSVVPDPATAAKVADIVRDSGVSRSVVIRELLKIGLSHRQRLDVQLEKIARLGQGRTEKLTTGRTVLVTAAQRRAVAVVSKQLGCTLSEASRYLIRSALANRPVLNTVRREPAEPVYLWLPVQQIAVLGSSADELGVTRADLIQHLVEVALSNWPPAVEPRRTWEEPRRSCNTVLPVGMARRILNAVGSGQSLAESTRVVLDVGMCHLDTVDREAVAGERPGVKLATRFSDADMEQITDLAEVQQVTFSVAVRELLRVGVAVFGEETTQETSEFSQEVPNHLP